MIAAPSPWQKIQCNAMLRSTGQQCRRWAMIGRRFCHLHGGKHAVGPMHHNWKGGRYSKYLPTGLVSRYQEALTDGDLLSSAHEVAALDARVSQLMERFGTTESAQRWKEAAGALRQVSKAHQAHVEALYELLQKQGDGQQSIAEQIDQSLQAVSEQIERLGLLIQEGVQDEANWAQILDHWQVRLKLVDSERRRLLDLQQYVTVGKVLELVAFVGESLKRHVEDRSALLRVQADLSRLLSGPIVERAPVQQSSASSAAATEE